MEKNGMYVCGIFFFGGMEDLLVGCFWVKWREKVSTSQYRPIQLVILLGNQASLVLKYHQAFQKTQVLYLSGKYTIP